MKNFFHKLQYQIAKHYHRFLVWCVSIAWLMIVFKFFNIGKANEEIVSLESRVAQLTSENASLQQNVPQVEAAAEGIRAELTEANAKLAQSVADLATAQASIASLSKEKESAVTALATHQANPSAEVKEMASAQAAQIVASVGVPPIAASVSAEPKPELTGKDRFLATIKIDTK